MSTCDWPGSPGIAVSPAASCRARRSPRRSVCPHTGQRHSWCEVTGDVQFLFRPPPMTAVGSLRAAAVTGWVRRPVQTNTIPASFPVMAVTGPAGVTLYAGRVEPPRSEHGARSSSRTDTSTRATLTLTGQAQRLPHLGRVGPRRGTRGAGRARWSRPARRRSRSSRALRARLPSRSSLSVISPMACIRAWPFADPGEPGGLGAQRVRVHVRPGGWCAADRRRRPALSSRAHDVHPAHPPVRTRRPALRTWLPSGADVAGPPPVWTCTPARRLRTWRPGRR